MFKIDREKFGRFVAGLRKSRGYTQKELAQRLYISDKAVSKWETGVSIPDTEMLIPLAELLDVSVTELLMCERMGQSGPIEAGKVEEIVKTAISYSEENPSSAYPAKAWRITYALSVVIGAIGLLLNCLRGNVSDPVFVALVLGAVFGAYFCFFAKTKLPAYYDENRIGMVQDGALRINLPGVAFNNSNWPHVVRVARIWACATAAAYPLFSAAMLFLFGGTWRSVEQYIFLALLLGGLLIPMIFVARKYE